MLNLERTQEKIKATHLLITGKTIPPALHQMIYDRIKENFVMDDLDRAIDAMERNDNPRFSWPILIKNLLKFKSLRMEADWQNEKMRDRDFHDDIENRNPELSAMLEAILNKDAEALQKYQLDREYPTSNAVVIGKDGRRRKMYIDPEQPGFKDAISHEKVQTGGESMALVTSIDLSKVEYVEIDERRKPPESTGWRTRKLDEDDLSEF